MHNQYGIVENESVKHERVSFAKLQVLWKSWPMDQKGRCGVYRTSSD
ncbi:hypothetical protein [Pseudomonas hunanensis]